MMSKLAKECENCVHFSKHQCLDANGESILKYNSENNQYVKLDEPYWSYAECKKNWGLPKVAYITAKDCNFYKQKDLV